MCGQEVLRFAGDVDAEGTTKVELQDMVCTSVGKR